MVKSDDPPAENGIITVIGLLGNSAAALVTAKDTTKKLATIVANILPFFMITPLLINYLLRNDKPSPIPLSTHLIISPPSHKTLNFDHKFSVK
jgi:hypothetical protein